MKIDRTIIDKLKKFEDVPIGIALVAVIFIILYTQTGCTPAKVIANNLEEEKFTQGCKVVRAEVGVGYLAQSGTVGVPCKVKCSSKLPPNYCFKYDGKTPFGNCNVTVGECK